MLVFDKMRNRMKMCYSETRTLESNIKLEIFLNDYLSTYKLIFLVFKS